VLDGIAETHEHNLAVVTYHAWWPSGSDPYYQYNPSENSARINYYGADYTPHAWFDGIVNGQYLTYLWESQIDTRATVPSPMAINLVVDYDNVTESGTVTAVMSATEAVTASNLKLRLALTESHLPPLGGFDEFNYAMRDMIPNPTGTSVSISEGDVVSQSLPFTLDLANEDFNNLEFVAWVQSDNTKEVQQAAKFSLRGANVTIWPDAPLSVPRGGTLFFNTQIVNHMNNMVSGDFWLSVKLPSGTELVIPEAYVNLPNPWSGQVQGWGTINLANELYVPTRVPTGVFTVIARIGQYPDLAIAESSFDFEITP
jgi:hypothetical protein